MTPPDEEPVTEVELTTFQIDESPVTNSLFDEFIQDKGYSTASLWTPLGWEFIQANAIKVPNYWYDEVWSKDPNVPATGVGGKRWLLHVEQIRLFQQEKIHQSQHMQTMLLKASLV